MFLSDKNNAIGCMVEVSKHLFCPANALFVEKLVVRGLDLETEGYRFNSTSVGHV